MNKIYSSLSRQLSAYALCICFAMCYMNTAKAQVTVINSSSAATLATALIGSGVTLISPTLTCPTDASGTFSVVSSTLGIPSGVVLTNGLAATPTTGFSYGVNIIDGGIASDELAANMHGAPGDVDLTALAGQPTYDACVLEFDFKASGDTIKFNYVFGSEEYPGYTCSEFNDVFGFFISGPGYAGPTDIALVPGTTIPVAINSINDGLHADPLGLCSGMGPGSPFPAYFVDNSSGTTITYDGLTTVLTAIARVNPCDTYHLKLGVADASDSTLDSGVFIEGGSLSSTPPAALRSVGLNGLPYSVRGCANSAFIFDTPAPADTALVVHYVIGGTAVNGYDYVSIPDSVVIPPFAISDTLYIVTNTVTPAGPVDVSLMISIKDPCDTGHTLSAPVSITIFDSFYVHVTTQDTAICLGQSVAIQTQPDSILGAFMHYIWTPSTGLDHDTLLDPTATPLGTTTYVISANLDPLFGCRPSHSEVTINVFTPPVLTTDSALVKTCVGIPVPLHVYASPSSGVSYTYNWAPPTYLDDPLVSNPVATPLATGDIIYNVTVDPVGMPFPVFGCSSTTSVDVHTEPNDFTLTNRDTTICIGQQVIVSIIGSNAFTYAWTPPNGVSDTSVKNPIITPTSTTDYTVTATYAACPAMIHDFNITVDVPAAPITFSDTICLGMSDTFNVKAADTSIYYQYSWTPGVYLSNDTIPNPIFTPLFTGPISYTVTVAPPFAAGCATQDFFNVIVLPNAISITTPDTAICLGSVVQINAVGNPLFNYQWTPTAGIELPQVLDPIISPDTSAEYVISGGFHRCPSFRDSIYIDVQPVPSVYIGGNRSKCEYDTMHVFGLINPGWYTHYAYHWSPGANFDDSTMLAAIYTNTATAEIYLTVTTPVGCSATDSATIFVNPNDFAGPSPGEVGICPGDSLQIVFRGGIVDYHWIPTTYVSDTTSPIPVLHPITSQDYTVILTSALGCLDTLDIDVTVFPAAVLNLGDSVTLYPGETYHIEPMTNCTSFAWFPPLGLSDALISDPIASPDVNTKYIVRGITENGCVVIDSISIYVDPNTLLAMPNAFTPGNGPNNELKIIKRGIATLNYFRIFNRWGNKVFETNDIDKGWDGSYNGTPQPLGVYVYEIQAVTNSGRIFVKQGNITLIR